MHRLLQSQAALLVRAKFLMGGLVFMLAILSSTVLQGTTYALANNVQLLDDMRQGSESSYRTGSFTALGGSVYFLNADDGNYQLWKSDKTSGDTQLVKTLCTGCNGYEYDGLTQTNGKLIIKSDEGLWASDGTEEGTTFIKSVSQIYNMTKMNGVLYFEGISTVEPYRPVIWTTDGTEAGTHTVDVFGDDSAGSYMSAASDKFYVTSYDSTTDKFKLWSYDGSTATLLRTLDNDSTFGSGIMWMVGVGNKMYFTANTTLHEDEVANASIFSSSQLWSTDGTVAGTELVVDLSQQGIALPKIANLQPLGQQLLFTADDGEHGNEPWITDGTAANTHMIADINPGAAGSDVFISGITELLNGKTFIIANDGMHGFEPWSTDGTAEGTSLLKDVFPGEEGSWAGQIHVLGDKVYFTAPDGQHGWEWWNSDGTEAGTSIAADINPGAGDANMYNDSVQDGALYFVADDGTHGYEPTVLR